MLGYIYRLLTVGHDGTYEYCVVNYVRNDSSLSIISSSLDHQILRVIQRESN